MVDFRKECFLTLYRMPPSFHKTNELSMTPTLFNIFRNDITDNFEDTLSTLLLLSTKVGSLLFTDYLLIIYIF
jgi:hypothetical protein